MRSTLNLRRFGTTLKTLQPLIYLAEHEDHPQSGYLHDWSSGLCPHRPLGHSSVTVPD
eukprot:CAMPEP_0185769440 /NCGR_PEP_ID=MMETSP1174-20130828/54026_1 /TAXON_ID=35687 /ORGANISM="Dictyocha speculum, Strain CCMP1381" /LENGTH=57 /DNA_ID=CAMNT_0028454509 /DNA_START=1107 /DNA_END=1280 /DNA_ORIENTATION=-